MQSTNIELFQVQIIANYRYVFYFMLLLTIAEYIYLSYFQLLLTNIQKDRYIKP